jgi:hypothetical protein
MAVSAYRWVIAEAAFAVIATILGGAATIHVFSSRLQTGIPPSALCTSIRRQLVICPRPG